MKLQSINSKWTLAAVRKAAALGNGTDAECDHDLMVENGDPHRVWRCTQCGYVYGSTEEGNDLTPAEITRRQRGPIMDDEDVIERLQFEVKQLRTIINDHLHTGILRSANECNCRAEHGADGAEHLLAIERMLRKLAP